ncbi:MAG: NADH-quinone oxidoreductase subunit NuoG [Trueperaceae bacterium]|nr:NADH-quinone oxidoreductase subunit NuoG [Trueperaceae bacterium]
MKVKVNDAELDVAQGTSVIDALFAAGYDVPYFCSQEYMSPVGACRMCLAKIGAPRKDRGSGEWIVDEETGERKIFWFPNPMATCTTQVMEGMVVDTLSKEVRRAQGMMTEYTLINHPLDCPTCDKGGACELQDRAYEYGSGHSRFDFDKRHQEKHHALSELITLDRERCIHCKRCVRYFEEVPGDEVLDFIERGSHTYIGNLETGLPNPFSGNITDICPVGALLDTSSRFRGRNWEYDHTDTTSLDDPGGSALRVDARTGRIERIKAGLNPEVNKTWIHDGERFGHEYADAPDRITTPWVREGDQLVPASWEGAARRIVEGLQRVDGKAIGVAIRADATLEEGVAAKALADHLGSGRVDHAPRPPASVVPGGAGATLRDVATSDALLVVGDPTAEAGIVDLRIKDALKGVSPPELLPHGVPIADLRLGERMPRKRDILTVCAPYRTDLMRHAGRAGTYPAGGEAALFRALSALAAAQDPERRLDAAEVDEAALGMPRAEADALVQRLRGADAPVLVWGGFVSADPEADAAARSFAQAVGAKVLILGSMANAYGLERIGVSPSHERYDYASMLSGEAKALVLSQLDPAADAAASKRLQELSFLVVHATFPTATTALADVILPAKTGYEKEGTTVNAEGRALPVRPVPVEAGVVEDFTGVVGRLGEAFGVRLDGRSARSARRVLRKRLGMDMAELPRFGARLPAPKGAARGVRALRAVQAGSGRALVVPSMVRIEYLDRNPTLRAEWGDAALRLHPRDAEARSLNAGDTVLVPVGGMTRRLRVAPSEDVPEGLWLVPATPDQPVGLYPLDVKGVRPAPRDAAPAEAGVA